ncbi:MAG TPA: Gfo/Idh/MocA family oxidoreductase [Actinomycetota bacterium]|nr:Gfo/Idh/MocA family oxidoreductase [Actinomycetota bacterium]
MKIGVVGCGYWGSKHIRVLCGIGEAHQVVAIDARDSRLVELKQAFPSLEVASSLDDVLDQCDAFVIATPPSTHASLALTALGAGKHVLVEKPLATRSVDARRMMEAAAESGAILMAGHTFEYNAAVWKLRELVESGELGSIYYLDSARLNLGLYQSDVNVIWDLAPHDVSIFNHVLGARPSVVQAWGARHGHRELEDVAYIRLQYFEPDVTATIHVSWLDPCKVRRVTVVGSQKMAVYNDLSNDERIRIYDKGLAGTEDGALQDVPMSYRYGEIRSPFVAFDEPLGIQDREFVQAALTGQQPLTDGANGCDVVRTLEAAEISLRESRPVHVDEIDMDTVVLSDLVEV